MSQESNMFTYEEALELLQNKWGIENLEAKLKSDRKKLLDEICLLIHEKLPFQSITVLGTAASDRQMQPSFDDVKERFLSGIGGLCYDFAIFSWCLLRALGFSVQMANATVTVSIFSPNDHTIVLVKGLENDDEVHLVDANNGFPIFRAISLNFTDKSPIFEDSFLEYKYIRHEGNILRMHGKGDTVRHNDPPIDGLDFVLGRWRRFYYFDPNQQPCESAKPAHNAYQAVASGLTPFTSSPRAVWFPGKRAVAIVNNKLMIENEAGEMVTTVLKSDEEIMKAYQVHFPQLKKDAVQRALAEWRRVSKS